MTPPSSPAIYHILHVDRLPSVIAAGGLLCDATITARGAQGTVIGMGERKAHRLRRPVGCHSGLAVGDCVPFYFCSRSVMLYVIHRANHPGLGYRGGQDPIIHLEADMRQVAAWADVNGRRWAFSLGNASADYAEFHCDLARLSQLNWAAINGTDFRTPSNKEGKQAEFLVEGQVPWVLFRRIGVINHAMAQAVAHAMAGAAHRPTVEVTQGWYY